MKRVLSVVLMVFLGLFVFVPIVSADDSLYDERLTDDFWGGFIYSSYDGRFGSEPILLFSLEGLNWSDVDYAVVTVNIFDDFEGNWYKRGFYLADGLDEVYFHNPPFNQVYSFVFYYDENGFSGEGFYIQVLEGGQDIDDGYWGFTDLLLTTYRNVHASPSDVNYQTGYYDGRIYGFDEGYDVGYDMGFNDGYIDGKLVGYNEAFEHMGDSQGDWFNFGYQEGYLVGFEKGLNDKQKGLGGVLGSVWSGVSSVLNIEILPDVKIAYIIAVPMVFGVIAFIIGRRRD